VNCSSPAAPAIYLSSFSLEIRGFAAAAAAPLKQIEATRGLAASNIVFLAA